MDLILFIPKCFQKQLLIKRWQEHLISEAPSAPTCCLKASGASSRPRQGPRRAALRVLSICPTPNNVLAVCLFADTWSF